MTACAMQSNGECFQQLIIVLLQSYSDSTYFPLPQELVEILHFKKDGKTALNWAYQNNERFMVMQLLKLEREIHGSEKKGLECLCYYHMGRDFITPWILESYSELYDQSKRKRWLKAFFTVLMGLVICSQLPYVLDIFSDIDLAVSYSHSAFGNETFNHSNLLLCYEKTGYDYTMNRANDSYKTFGTAYSENVHDMFQVAYYLTMVSVLSSGILFMFCIVAEYRSNTMSSLLLLSNVQCFLLNKVPQFCHVFLTIFQVFLYILFWPLVHIIVQLLHLTSIRKTKYKDQYDKTNETWNIIKAVEYGIESSFQLLLHLWLLQPFLPILFLWGGTELLQRCITGISHFSSFGNLPACYIEKVLGKIMLAIISLTLGMAQTKCNKPGLGLSENLTKMVPILLSILAQILGRILAISRLILLATPMGDYKYVIFFSIHLLVVFFIKTVTRQENKSISRQRPDGSTSMDQVSDCIKQHFLNCLKSVASICSSTIVLINLQDEKRNSSFISHSFFFLLVLLENTLLVCLPYMVPDRYPVWLPMEGHAITVGWVIALWLVGVIAHVLHYKCAHPLALLNGPEMSWKKQASEWYVQPISTNIQYLIYLI